MKVAVLLACSALAAPTATASLAAGGSAVGGTWHARRLTATRKSSEGDAEGATLGAQQASTPALQLADTSDEGRSSFGSLSEARLRSQRFPRGVEAPVANAFAVKQAPAAQQAGAAHAAAAERASHAQHNADFSAHEAASEHASEAAFLQALLHERTHSPQREGGAGDADQQAVYSPEQQQQLAALRQQRSAEAAKRSSADGGTSVLYSWTQAGHSCSLVQLSSKLAFARSAQLVPSAGADDSLTIAAHAAPGACSGGESIWAGLFEVRGEVRLRSVLLQAHCA